MSHQKTMTKNDDVFVMCSDERQKMCKKYGSVYTLGDFNRTHDTYSKLKLR